MYSTHSLTLSSQSTVSTKPSRTIKNTRRIYNIPGNIIRSHLLQIRIGRTCEATGPGGPVVREETHPCTSCTFQSVHEAVSVDTRCTVANCSIYQSLVLGKRKNLRRSSWQHFFSITAVCSRVVVTVLRAKKRLNCSTDNLYTLRVSCQTEDCLLYTSDAADKRIV